MANLLSIEEAAKLLDMAPRKAAALFDSGRLGGFRDPISAVRRIRPEDVVKFLRERDLPIPRGLVTPVNNIQTR